ncbi:hypothetical protein PG993_005598 [Apiospora rasikravindrae]|uniref:Uncharacterized protein n=1 Tax=Apiospora rasikravindrae TaxID=990691 RepID=A0ABR1TIK2_9PEZI
MSSGSLASYFPYLLDAACMIVGSLLIFSGSFGTFINTPKMADVYGLGSATSETWVLMPAATGRNLGAGIFVWTMLLLGERKSLGVFFLCWTWAGIADTKVLFDHPKGTKLGVHIRNIVILIVLGALLIGSAP